MAPSLRHWPGAASALHDIVPRSIAPEMLPLLTSRTADLDPARGSATVCYAPVLPSFFFNTSPV